jgi:hypothetical protein
MDELVFKKDLIPQQQSIIKKLASQETDKKQILVIGRHRYYNQLSFFAMEADITQTGKIKNPVSAVDPMNLIWKADKSFSN